MNATLVPMRTSHVRSGENVGDQPDQYIDRVNQDGSCLVQTPTEAVDAWGPENPHPTIANGAISEWTLLTDTPGILLCSLFCLKLVKAQISDQTTLPSLLATKSIARRLSRGFTGMSFPSPFKHIPQATRSTPRIWEKFTDTRL